MKCFAAFIVAIVAIGTAGCEGGCPDYDDLAKPIVVSGVRQIVGLDVPCITGGTSPYNCATDFAVELAADQTTAQISFTKDGVRTTEVWQIGTSTTGIASKAAQSKMAAGVASKRRDSPASLAKF